MVAGRLAAVYARIGDAAVRSGRAASAVTLVAVSKSRSVDEILEAYEAGQRDFGENRVEEMLAKVPLLPPDVRWHFLGTVQSRKAAAVRPETFLLHSMDRMSLARRWAAPGEVPPCLLQVNVGREPQKHGVAPEAVEDVLDEMSGEGIEPIGLMAIPPAPEVPEAARPFFAEMARLAERTRHRRPRLVELSMGMTDDFEVAVEEGATIVRVGRAIFGPRTG
jgi:pyridoxal phosphate enzyme (YggS family)